MDKDLGEIFALLLMMTEWRKAGSGDLKEMKHNKKGPENTKGIKGIVTEQGKK